MRHLIHMFIICVSLLFTVVYGKCGYDSCPALDNNKLNIHFIPHSHDDVGWMTTPDGYYDGSTRAIITNVVKALDANPERRFTQVEIYFFNRWWREQTQQVRDLTQKLVNEGRLVFTNGGWTVNDEGAAHYNNIIDQMTLGLKFLNTTFGLCGHPKVSWQIDPFGASLEMPSLYAQMGFDAHVYNRGPTHGEYVWHASKDLDQRIFTTILHSHYSAPNGFNFENGNNPVTDQNVGTKLNQLIGVAKQWNQDYGSANHVLVTMGDDFQYKTADNWFNSMDRLIREAKEHHPEINLHYSTPNCYIKAINSLNKTFEERDVDYLSYWVGYYSNRPSLKYQDRLTNNMLQASKQLEVTTRLDYKRNDVYLDEARNEVAVMTHHDAITGTSPQATADDYTSRLQSGYTAGKAIIEKAYSYVKHNTKDASNDVFCDVLNITDCKLTETNDKIAVTAYNPIARTIEKKIRVPITDGNYNVFESNGQKVSNVALLPVSEAVKQLPERKGSLSTHELVFSAQLPGLGFNTYFIEKVNTYKNKRLLKTLIRDKTNVDMKGKSFTLQVDETTGQLKSITMNGKTYKLNQSFKWYKSIGGQKGLEDSGSYQFCPDGMARDYPQQSLISRHTDNGVHELNQQFSDYIHQTVRTYEDRDYIEFDWTVGGIPISDNWGKEIITRFESDLMTEGVFYTDANGRQTIRRKYDPNHKGCVNDVITGNWFPIYSHISVKDENNGLQMSVLNDRTQGGSSLNNGSIELMVHRRLTYKGRGGDFKVDEPGVDGKGLEVRGKHYLFFNTIQKSPQLVRSLAEKLLLPPIITFNTYSTINDYKIKYQTQWSPMGQSLPENIHLLSLENWSQNQVLLRLEHIYESSDNNLLSKPIDLSLDNIFKSFNILSANEMNLAANQLLSQTKRMNWNSKHTYYDNRHNSAIDDTNNLTVRLTPQQIRTFILTIDNNYHKEDECTYHWVNAKQSSIPTDAYVAGYDVDKTPLNVCRYKYKDDMIAGKADKNLGCVLTYGGKEVYIENDQTFEVLIANNVQWVPRHGEDPIPEGALIVGTKGDPNAKTYIGRCFTHNAEIPGKVDYNFYYGFSGYEHKECSNHDILVCH
ncbi:lysosomal alpha-mannosidase-like [Oppia nitens]|uniref:lysosomal alpha-mannosidase-like n=1 Tax=Oppia nitens TaxID=1686743 RepID=UPI0023DBAA3F|nr:lysosomal alpha-mannosidase-like [Oppia nitens]